VINPFFRVTNSLASLWFAAKAVDLNDDLLLLNGDVIYEPGVLEAVLAAPKALTMLIDTSIIQRGDYRLKVEDDYIVDQGKQLPNEETSGEYVGIARLNKEFVPLYLARVRDLVEREEKYNMWWEEALFAIRDDFGMKIHVVDVNGLFWAEADFIEDVERIEAWFEAREHRSNVTAEELADVATRAAAASAGGDADGVLAAGLGQPRPDRTT
jgi:choline kinase